MVIEVKDFEITDLIACFDFKTEEKVANKKEQILIKPFLILIKMVMMYLFRSCHLPHLQQYSVYPELASQPRLVSGSFD